MQLFTILFIALFVINGLYLLDVSSFSKRLGISDGGKLTGVSPFNPARAQQLLKILLSSSSSTLKARPELRPQAARIRVLLVLSVLLFTALMYVAFTQSM